MIKFTSEELKALHRPAKDSAGEENGQITIIGGSKLFHGAPLLSLKAASRIVDMVFFASPDPLVGEVAKKIKSKLLSFIWVPWEDVEAYIEKSDAVLIGPGFMRFGSEKTHEHERHHDNHDEGKETRIITKKLLQEFPDKKWVIDAGSLQVMDPEWIPEGSILTPNKKEFEMLFKFKIQKSKVKITNQNLKIVEQMANIFNCTIVVKGPKTFVASADHSREILGGNAGMTKGGTGDVLAGLTVSLLAKNTPFLAACASSFIIKAAADELYRKVGTNYNAEDLANQIPISLNNLLK